MEKKLHKFTFILSLLFLFSLLTLAQERNDIRLESNSFYKPTVGNVSNVTIIKGESIALFTSGENVTWVPQIGLDCYTCIKTIASPTTTTTYYAYNNSIILDSVKIAVINCTSDFNVPNAFSPNGDGKNDELEITGVNCIAAMRFSIYSQWGEKVFECNCIDKIWDGKNKGKPVDEGVYVYYFHAVSYNGEPIDKRGNITIRK